MNPFWSPDGRFVGFFADGKLKTISIGDASIRTLCDAPNTSSGSWSRDGVILFGSTRGPLYRVPDTGGTPVAVTTLDQTRMETGHIRPQFMPDGRRFLFLATSGEPGQNGSYIGTLDSPERHPVDGVTSSVAYAAPGYLVFARGGALMARPFDADRLQGRGDPITLGEVRQSPSGDAVFSVSQTGALAYQAASVSRETRLVWLTRAGNPVGNFPARPGFHALSLAPDRERAIVEAQGDLWWLDGNRGTASRFTADPLADSHPMWSPDGRLIAYANGVVGVVGRTSNMLKVATGLAEAEPLLATPTRKFLTDWSQDGSTLVFEEQHRDTGWNIGAVPVAGDRTHGGVCRDVSRCVG